MLCDNVRNEFNVIVKKFLCGVPLKSINIDRVIDEFDWNTQELLLKRTVNDPLVVKYPLKISYQTQFLKKFIDIFERNRIETHDDIYLSYCKLLEEGSVEFYKHYKIDDDIVITLKESTSFISEGTTGLCSWQASLALSEWCVLNADGLKNKDVLELGCGVGLVGITIARICQPRSITLTDCHESVLKTLCHNVSLNLLETTQSKRKEENQTVLYDTKKNQHIRSVESDTEDIQNSDVYTDDNRVNDIRDDRVIIRDDREIIRDDRVIIQDDRKIIQDGCEIIRDGREIIRDNCEFIQDNCEYIRDNCVHFRDDCVRLRDDRVRLRDDRVRFQDNRETELNPGLNSECELISGPNSERELNPGLSSVFKPNSGLRNRESELKSGCKSVVNHGCKSVVNLGCKSVENLGCGRNDNVLLSIVYNNIDVNVLDLNWEEVGKKCSGSPDVIFGADIVYDSEIFEPLSSALVYYFRVNNKAIAIFACTERNKRTLQEFLTVLEDKNLVVKEIPSAPKKHFYWNEDIPIRFFEISSA